MSDIASFVARLSFDRSPPQGAIGIEVWGEGRDGAPNEALASLVMNVDPQHGGGCWALTPFAARELLPTARHGWLGSAAATVAQHRREYTAAAARFPGARIWCPRWDADAIIAALLLSGVQIPGSIAGVHLAILDGFDSSATHDEIRRSISQMIAQESRFGGSVPGETIDGAMTSPTDRRWYRGTAVRCSCSGAGTSCTVVSQRPLGALPRVRIDDAEHDCETAVLIDRRASRATAARELKSWAPRVRLDELTRTWLRAVPASQRAAVVAAALAEAARRGPVARALEALYDALEVQRDLGADFRDRDAVTLEAQAVEGDDDWIHQYERAFAAAAAKWRTEAGEDSIRDAAVAAALAAAVECDIA